MILQALVSYYESLAAKGLIARPGWGVAKVSYALELSAAGELLEVHSLKIEEQRDKKAVMRPREMLLPLPVKRTVGIEANFLCDNAAYILGFDGKGKPARAKACFEKAKELHLSLLGEADNATAKAVCAFFNNWNVACAREHALIAPIEADMEGGANMVFIVGGAFAHEDPQIAALWQARYDEEEEGEKTRCLVTGELAHPAALHPSIKGVRDAQSSGAALISFNAPAFCSFGKEQNHNAPMSKYAAFAYTTALNRLIADKERTVTIGDSTVVFWAEDATTAYADAMTAFLAWDSPVMENKDLKAFMKAIAQGETADWDGAPLCPENRFYILALAPNAARLSVRFFLQSSFGALALNIAKHYEDLKIETDNRGRFEDIPLWALLQETVNPKARDKKPSSQMAGDMLRAVLTGGRDPATLSQQAQLRRRAERSVTRGRAAIIKAYLLRNATNEIYKEAATVKLNEDTTYQPYILGRMFSVLEEIQECANPGINTTIKDKYFTSASATPAMVFPTLVNLMEKHMRKIDKPYIKTYFAKQFCALAKAVTEDYPAHLGLQDRGIFQLGYYHQKQRRYEKKKDTENEMGGIK